VSEKYRLLNDASSNSTGSVDFFDDLHAAYLKGMTHLVITVYIFLFSTVSSTIVDSCMTYR
jgi:succinylglutamate desuccinylase